MKLKGVAMRSLDLLREQRKGKYKWVKEETPMNYKQLKHLKSSAFKRRCGVYPETFEQMMEILRPHLDCRGKRGGQCKLSVED